MLQHEQQFLAASDGHQVPLQTWWPEDDCKGVIQIAHGLGEYGDRYARFAHSAVGRGYAVCVHDHRGHGPKAELPRLFAASEGWRKVIADVELVNTFLRQRFGDRTLILLGHSMGSFIAQSFAMLYSDRLSGMILSASTWPVKIQLLPALALAQLEVWRVGPQGNSALLDKLGFDNLNKPFEPTRTSHDWLSRDASEVDKYLADPLCGGPYCAGLWRDLLLGLKEISSDKSLLQIPADLPILITGGGSDPVGGDKGMGQLAMHYAQTGHRRLKLKIYADGRHEMLNDINRDEVTSDWLDWVAATTGT
jgi:alpha-beta hydrolase superfamily lysophospholipase